MGNSIAANHQRQANNHDAVLDMSMYHTIHAAGVTMFNLTFLIAHIEPRLTCDILYYFQSIPSLEEQNDWCDSCSSADVSGIV